MGDIVVREDEIGELQAVLIELGLSVTGPHNHFVREEPSGMHMHVGDAGPQEELARGVKAVFDEVHDLRSGDPAGTQAQTVPNTHDATEMAHILVHGGEMSRRVYNVTIGRPDVNLRVHGVLVTTFTGFNTWAAWQGTPGRAAVAVEFAKLEDETARVI